MGSMSLEDFVSIYIDAVSETIQESHFSDIDIFYEQVYTRVSGKTGLSREEIVSLHHPFHWILFLEKDSPLEFFNTGKKENSCGIRILEKNYPIRKTELVTGILQKYRTWLQQRLDRISEYTG